MLCSEALAHSKYATHTHSRSPDEPDQSAQAPCLSDVSHFDCIDEAPAQNMSTFER